MPGQMVCCAEQIFGRRILFSRQQLWLSHLFLRLLWQLFLFLCECFWQPVHFLFQKSVLLLLQMVFGELFFSHGNCLFSEQKLHFFCEPDSLVVLPDFRQVFQLEPPFESTFFRKLVSVPEQQVFPGFRFSSARMRLLFPHVFLHAVYLNPIAFYSHGRLHIHERPECRLHRFRPVYFVIRLLFHISDISLSLIPRFPVIGIL